MGADSKREKSGQRQSKIKEKKDITDRKRIEDELRIKDYAIESSMNGIAIADLEGNVTYVNKAALEMWGGDDPSEVLGNNAIMFSMSEEVATEALRAVVEEGSWTGEEAGKRKDGSPIEVILSANLVKDDNGEPVCMMASFVDVTDRKRIEEDLLIRDKAIASSIDGIAIGDLEGNVTYVNDTVLRMWGTDDPSEILGRPVIEFALSEDEAKEALSLLLKNGSWSGDIAGKRKDGSVVIVHLSANLVYGEGGEPICTMASFMDITDRKRIEDELRIKDYAIESSINGIAIGDLEGNLTYVNEAFLRMWGGEDSSEVIGNNAVVFAQSEEEGLKIIQRVLERGNWFGEVVGKTKEGRPLTVELSANLVRDGNGESICIMVSFVDITDRKVAEQKLAELNEELEKRVEERTEELIKTNEKLRKEIEERKQAERTLMLKEKELRLKSLNLEEANTALKVLLKRREEDKDELQEKVLGNVKELVLPYIEKLKDSRLTEEQMTYAGICESNLTDIISPFLSRLSSKYINLTPTEIQVATLVKEGKSTKEMADILNISDRAVEFHRNNIRKKLGLKNKKVNLRSYLVSFARP